MNMNMSMKDFALQTMDRIHGGMGESVREKEQWRGGTVD